MHKIILPLILLISLSSCSTITRGTTQAFTVTSEPSNATVEFSSGEECKTPCTVTKKRKEAFTVTVSKDGYQSSSASVQSQVAGAGAAAMAGNVLVGGIIGAAVDAGTGATKELVPNPLHITLDKEQKDSE